MAIFWRYVRLQLIVFVFGIVGPIFLVIYFVSQPDPTLKWAYWFGLFIIAADVLIAIGLTKATEENRLEAAAKHERKRKRDSSASSGPT